MSASSAEAPVALMPPVADMAGLIALLSAPGSRLLPRSGEGQEQKDEGDNGNNAQTLAPPPKRSRHEVADSTPTTLPLSVSHARRWVAAPCPLSCFCLGCLAFSGGRRRLCPLSL